MSNSNLHIQLDLFEGPLDLLLHLIRAHEYDIMDIPIAEIARQYNKYLDIIQELNLNLASEYLVMSATLARIKSRMLLPPAEDEEEEEDPRIELVQQLLEYQRYKEAALEISERPILGRDVFARKFPIQDSLGTAEEGQYIEVDIFQLMAALREVIQKMPQDSVHEIHTSRIGVRERMSQLLEQITDRSSMLLTELFATSPDRSYIIVTFLALLELIRQQMVMATQIDRFGPIRILPLFAKEEPTDGS